MLKYLFEPIVLTLTALYIDKYSNKSKLMVITSLINLAHFLSWIIIPADCANGILWVPYILWTLYIASFNANDLTCIVVAAESQELASTMIG